MKLPQKLVGLGDYQEIKNHLLKVVHNSMTLEEFEESWMSTITTYDLEEYERLAKLYDEREQWVPAFLKSNFFTGDDAWIFIISCTSYSSRRHLQKKKKRIEKPTRVGPGGESSLLKLVKDFYISQIERYFLLRCVHAWFR
jgi:hypothetical protein